MSVDPATFRSVLAQWPSGVTVVTCKAGDAWHGLTASSFSSVSLEPPLVLVCVARGAFAHDLLVGAGAYAVSILGKDQADVGKRFARFDPAQPERFAPAEWEQVVTGAPVLRDALGWLDCRVRQCHDAGDHTILVGEVVAAGTPRLTSPLLYHARTWGQFADILPEAVTMVDATAPGSHRDVVFDARTEADEKAIAAVRDRRAVVANAFTVPPEQIGEIVARLVAAASSAIVLADEAGDASPVAVREVCREARLRAGPVPLGVRLADGEGFGLANLLVALKSGVSDIDVGGSALSRERAMLLLERMELPVEATAR